MDEGGFAGAGDAGDGDEHAHGDFDIDAAEVVGASAFKDEHFAAGGAAAGGNGDGELAGEVASCEGVGVGEDLLHGACGEELAAEFSGAGAEVEEVVCGAEDVGVVLDDEDGVAEVSEVLEDADEAVGVAGVESDGGLVEDVEGSDEAGTEGGSELDALGFTAGEGAGEAVEGEVFEADGVEEADALADFFEDGAGDLLLHGGEVDAVEEDFGLGDGEGGDFADVFAFDADGAGFGAETLAAAVWAEGVAAVFGEHDADVELVFFAIHIRKEAVDAEEAGAARVLVAVEEDFVLEGCEVLPGDVEGDGEFGGVALEIGIPGAVLGTVPGVDSAAGEGEGFVGDDEVEVEVNGVAEALATGACAEGIVEAEETGLGLLAGTVAVAALVGGGGAQAGALDAG